MATIPINFEDSGGGLRLTLPVIINSPKHRIHASTTVFFDTGCPSTFVISEGEALRLKLPFSAMESKGIIAFGSLKYESFALKNLEITLRDKKDERVQLTVPEVSVLKSTKRDNKAAAEALQMPSLIGLDFLNVFDFSLHVFPKKEAYFEKQVSAG